MQNILFRNFVKSLEPQNQAAQPFQIGCEVFIQIEARFFIENPQLFKSQIVFSQ